MTSGLRIVHLHAFDFASGGGEVYVREVARRQQQAGHAVTVVGVGDAEGLPASAGPFRGLARLRPALVRLEREAPDAVHLHGVYLRLSPLVVRAIRKRWPTLATIHHVAPICFRDSKILRRDGSPCVRPLGTGCVRSGCHRPLRDAGWLGPYEALLRMWQLTEYRRLDRVIVGSRYLADEMLRNGVPSERLVHLPLFSRWDAEPAPAPSTSHCILFAGRLSPEKGAHVLLDALARLEAPGWTARLVGEGPEAGALREQALRLGIADRVELVGAVDAARLAELYREARLVAVPSTAPETFSLVGVEAMAWGRPVVAAAGGGVWEWLAEGETGIAVSPSDPAALAGAVDRLMRDPGLADRLGGEARRRAGSRFRAGEHLEQLERVYRAAAADRAQSPPDAVPAGGGAKRLGPEC